MINFKKVQPRYRPLILLSVVVVGFHFFHRIPKMLYEKDRDKRTKVFGPSE